MPRNLLLVNPIDKRRTGLSSQIGMRFPPLGLGMVAALTPEHWDVQLADENFTPFAYRRADLVGLTAFTSTVNRAYEIARIYREKGIATVLGGIHASTCVDEALRFVNTVVVGEAETVWPTVIADFEAGRMKRVYHGEWPDLTGDSRPRRDLFDSRYTWATIQTARGCPMDCDFCSVSTFNGRRYRQRPVEVVLDELATIPQRNVFFVDDNIIGVGRKSAERAIRLFEGMVQRGIRKNLLCQASMNFGDDERVLEAASKAGCRMVIIGVEAEDREALGGINKKINLAKLGADYEHTFRLMNRHKIVVLGTFVYGADTDTPETLRRRNDFVINGAVNVVQTTYLTALPGTRMFKRLSREGRMLYSNFPDDWVHFDMCEVTHRPLSMTARELHDAGAETRRRVFCRRTLWRKALNALLASRSPLTALWTFFVYRNFRAISQKVDARPYVLRDPSSQDELVADACLPEAEDAGRLG